MLRLRIVAGTPPHHRREFQQSHCEPDAPVLTLRPMRRGCPPPWMPTPFLLMRSHITPTDCSARRQQVKTHCCAPLPSASFIPGNSGSFATPRTSIRPRDAVSDDPTVTGMRRPILGFEDLQTCSRPCSRPRTSQRRAPARFSFLLSAVVAPFFCSFFQRSPSCDLSLRFPPPLASDRPQFAP